jgi:hypothetical protein
MSKFVGVATTALATAPGGPPFATLYVSAAVVITGIEAGVAHITAKLWMYDNTPSGALYATPKGIEIGWLNEGAAGYTIPGTADSGWTPVEIDGYLAASAIVDDLEPVWRTAKFDYQFICADCHTTHAVEKYSSMQWSIIMARMAKFAKLEPEDAMPILKWLQTVSSTRDTRK